eukprot:scaffold16000_cov87-Phaeocystis_antarctica.AAC.2
MGRLCRAPLPGVAQRLKDQQSRSVPRRLVLCLIYLRSSGTFSSATARSRASRGRSSLAPGREACGAAATSPQQSSFWRC